MHDQVKGESFQIDKRITIGNDDDSNATTRTVQEEQQQQEQQVEWLLYENGTYGVNVLYPSAWTEQDSILGDDDGFNYISNFFY